MKSTFQDFYNDIQKGNKLSSPEDLQKRRKASFAGVPFYWLTDSVTGGVRYNEQSIAKGTDNNSNIVQPLGAEALKIEVTGKVIGIEQRKALLDAFIKYNNNYINSRNKSPLDILGTTGDANFAGNLWQDSTTAGVNLGKASLILPTLTVILVIVADYKFTDKIDSIGAYEFTATFVALPDKVDFSVTDPKDSLKASSIFAKDSIIKKAINAIKDFNLSQYLNGGLDYYNAFMAKYQDISDIRAAAENIKNTAESLSSLTSNLLGDDNTVSETTNAVEGIIKDPLAVASDPVGMLGSIGKIFTGISATKGLAFKRRKTYKDIIKKEPEPITNAPYNAIKIINQKFISQYVKSLSFICYCDELLNSDFTLTKDIIDAQNELKNLFITLNPTMNTIEINKIKEKAVAFLKEQEANSYNLVEVTTNPICLPQFLYLYFGRVEYNDAMLLKKLNPSLNLLKVEGKVVIPKGVVL